MTKDHNEWKNKQLDQMTRAELLEMKEWALYEMDEWRSFLIEIIGKLDNREPS